MMTQDEIISMAREAGFEVNYYKSLESEEVVSFDPIITYNLERFAALVAEPWIETNKALAKEIIELKKQAEQYPMAWAYIDSDGSFMDALDRQHGAYQTPLYANPVRTKDLTDDDLNKLMDYWSESERSAYGGAWAADGEYVDMKMFARAVIAADREKNK